MFKRKLSQLDLSIVRKKISSLFKMTDREKKEIKIAKKSRKIQ